MEKDQEHYKVREPKLEPPADGHRDKHVNFRAAEEERRDVSSHEGQDDYSADRRREREEGLRKGGAAAGNE
ncbi:hypothetical protein [Flaviaesturariibacter amylovorans]|uniref:Uncharacterized protein n=1 Tax=Flaviaesturariibacter amylovorans TaxID=1084520 RepID=A0ABP8GFL1_9BACT